MKIKPLHYAQFDVNMLNKPNLGRACAAADHSMPNGRALLLGVLLAIRLYCGGSTTGYYLVWDDDTLFEIETKTGLDSKTVEELVKTACAYGIFDSGLYETERILTSVEIQDMYFSAASRVQRRTCPFGLPYLLVDLNTYGWLSKDSERRANISEHNENTSEENEPSSENNDVFSENTPKYTKTNSGASEKNGRKRKEVNGIEKNKTESNQNNGDISPEMRIGFLFFSFFFRNFSDPYGEAKRCLDHYRDGIRDINAVADAWVPSNAKPRFDDERILAWARTLYSFAKQNEGREKALTILRNIHNAKIDRGRNELTVRMTNNKDGITVQEQVEANPALKAGFDKVTITKCVGS